MKALTFYDAFHGIGGFRRGLEEAGMSCAGGCEIDKYACEAYGVVNGEECEPTDIRTINPVQLRGIDCFVFGWPCQDNSIAGKREGQQRGDEQTDGNRSGLLYRATEILRIAKFPYFIAENVPGLFSVNNGRDFYTTIREFANVGYDVQWQLLNTRWFLPQNRERIFFVGHLRGLSRPEIFPITEADGRHSKTNQTDSRVIRWVNQNDGAVIDDVFPALKASGGTDIRKRPHIIQRSRGYNKDGIHEVAPTLTKNSYEQNNYLFDGDRIRKPTPLEYFRLQGYPDWWLTKCKEAGISDSQLYKMAGNGVSVPPVREIGTRLMRSC